MRDLFSILMATVNSWLDDKAPRLGAALAFYSAFSLGPLLVIAVAIVSAFFGEEAARGELDRAMDSTFGPTASAAIKGLLKSSTKPGATGTATVLGIMILFVSATAVVIQLKDALNTIWSVRPKPGRAIRVFFRDYVISIAALLGLAFILMTSLVVTAGLAVVTQLLGHIVPVGAGAIELVNFLVSFGFITALFAAMFKLLPDVKIRWRDVIHGAIFTALLFTLGRFVVGAYLGYVSYDSTYGAAASVMVVLAWVYYMAQIFFLGAELTKTIALARGVKTVPSRDVDVVREVTLDAAATPTPPRLRPS